MKQPIQATNRDTIVAAITAAIVSLVVCYAMQPAFRAVIAEWLFQPAHAAYAGPNKGDAQICVINAWLRANVPTSPYLPENGWNDYRDYRCPDEPVKP